MALTRSRWIALAALAFVLAPVLIFFEYEPRGYVYTERDRLQARAGRAEGHMRAAAERIRTDQLIDSLTRSVPASAGTALRVSYDRALDSTPRRLLSMSTGSATRERPAASRVGIDINFVVDSVQMIDGIQRRGYHGALSVNYLLPRRGSADRCIVVARIKPWGLNEFASEASSHRLLGPCAFYEAYGAPGPAMERWLARGGWAFAQRATTDRPIFWEGRWNRDEVPLRYMLGALGVACAKGAHAACANALENPDITGLRVRDRLVMTEYNPYIMSSGWYSREWSLGSASTALLADMARDLGPERFTLFWQSDADPAAAFRAATNTEISDWTHDWVVKTYHAENAGPGVSGTAWAWGLALLALSLGVVLRSAERRQMA
jgi:hypothetical protein